MDDQCNLASADAQPRAEWRPIESAPKDALLLGIVDGCVRLIRWGKTSHVPMYGFCLADQGAEEFDLCEPTHWFPIAPPPPTTEGTPTQDAEE